MPLQPYLGQMRVTDANDDPVPFAKIFTYLPGTTTPFTVHTDAGLTVAASNPIIADGSGFVPNIYSRQTIKIDCQTQFGVQVPGYPQDPAIMGFGPDLLDAMRASGLRCVSGGTANAITITTGLSLTAIPLGMQIRIRLAASNTAAATIAVDGLAPVAVQTVLSTALPAGYTRVDADTVLTWSGTAWIASRNVERGNGAGGDFLRFENGWQECRHVLSSSSGGAVTWTYERAFVAATVPYVSGTVIQATLSRTLTIDATPGATSLDFSTRNPATDARGVNPAHLFASGRWY
jgi:hypothetical protein